MMSEKSRAHSRSQLVDSSAGSEFWRCCLAEERRGKELWRMRDVVPKYVFWYEDVCAINMRQEWNVWLCFSTMAIGFGESESDDTHLDD